MDNNQSQQGNQCNQVFTQPLKPQLYDFYTQQDFKQDHHMHNNHIRKTATTRIRPTVDNLLWKPKLPSKKLYQQPKFLLSLQRKKIRVITGLKAKPTTISSPKKSSFKSQKIKTPSFIRNQRSIQTDNSHLFRPQDEVPSNFHKNFKTPHLNFNLQYMIKKRKQYRSDVDKQEKKGSNAPYLTFFNSGRFDLYTRNASQDKTSRKVQSKTAKLLRSNTRK